MVDLCEQKGDAIVICFTGGKTAIANSSRSALRNRRFYRWYHAENMSKKKASDWQSGGSVIEMLKRFYNYR